MQKKIQLSLVTVALTSSLYAVETIELDSITVTSATKTTQSIADVTSNISVITAKEIEAKRYTTVAEALNSVAGVNFTSNGGLGKSTSVQVRGFDSKRVLVLIDGVRYNDITGLSGAPFEHLMIGDVERIEIVKGAQSGVWGADATAGVINIITKSAKDGVHSSVNVEYGSFNTKKYGASVSYKADSYYLKLSSQVVDSDGFSAQAPKDSNLDDYEDDGYKNTTSSLKAGFNITETNKVDISHTYIDASSEYDSSTPNDDASSTTKDQFTKINFNHIDSFNEVDIYAQRSIFSRDSSYGEYDGEINEYGLKSNISYSDDDFVVVGGDYKTFEHKNDLNEEYDNKSVFLTNSNVIDGLTGGRTIVSESIRYDDFDKFDSKTTGKVGVKHHHAFLEGFIGSFNYGTAYNVPTLYQLFEPASASGVVGNENLTPESTKSMDISFEYKGFRTTYFSNKIENMIDWGNGYENIEGTSTIKGYEFEYSGEVIQDVSISANYTILDATDSDGKDLARRAKSSGYFGVDYYGITDLHLGVNAQYIGERYDSADSQGEQTGKYTVYNLVANYDISKNLQTYVKVDNITDEYYQVIDGYATAPLSGYVGLIAKY